MNKFKEGDLVYCSYEQDGEKAEWLQIIKYIEPLGKNESREIYIEDYAGAYISNKPESDDEFWINSYSDAAQNIRMATEEERQQLIKRLESSLNPIAKQILKML